MRPTYFVAQYKENEKWTALLIALPPRTDLVSYWKEYLPEAECANVFNSKKEAVEFYNQCIGAYASGIEHVI